jgi:hypothetical protein
MKTENQLSNLSPNALTDAEATLRLIAHLPAPVGLEDRIHAGLQAGLHAQPRLLSWPTASGSGWLHGTALRSAAAAAIVSVVVGGGWSVYSRIQPSQPIHSRVQSIAQPQPPHAAVSAGFSSAGAMRTPKTLVGPAPLHAATTEKLSKATAQSSLHHSKTASADKSTVPSVVSAAK